MPRASAAKTAETLYLDTTKVCRRYGRHRTWLWRQLKRDFPPPDLMINGLHYWAESTLCAYDAAKAKAAAE